MRDLLLRSSARLLAVCDTRAENEIRPLSGFERRRRWQTMPAVFTWLDRSLFNAVGCLLPKKPGSGARRAMHVPHQTAPEGTMATISAAAGVGGTVYRCLSRAIARQPLCARTELLPVVRKNGSSLPTLRDQPAMSSNASCVKPAKSAAGDREGEDTLVDECWAICNWHEKHQQEVRRCLINDLNPQAVSRRWLVHLRQPVVMCR